MKQTTTKIPIIEWFVAAFGLLVLAAAIVLILVGEVRRDDETPIVTVRVEGIHQAGALWAVTFEAQNDGSVPAGDLTIRVDLRVGDSTESADAQLDYLPAHSTRGGGVFFTRDPRAGRLTLAPVSYRKP